MTVTCVFSSDPQQTLRNHMIPTSLATALPRCPGAVISSQSSKIVQERRFSTSNQTLSLRTRRTSNHFRGSTRRSTSTSAVKANPRTIVEEWNELQRQADDIEPQGSTRSLKSNLRALLRDIAQPVAVVTSFMPSSSSYNSSSSTPPIESGNPKHYPQNGSLYHGATLSSFTSIAMDPYPLVSFALRIPSRMASVLRSLSKSSPSAHMVINLLSSSQASTALTFSRPDMYPTPFLGSSSGAIAYTLSQDGLPIITDAIGALSCQLVGGPIPLHDLEYLSSRESDSPSPIVPALRPGEVASELFIARVVRVEEVKREKVEEEDEATLQPLIYHRRSYTSCKTE